MSAAAGAQTPASASGSTSAPAMQLAPDQAAFRAANATVDKQQRAAALQNFLRDFPKSKRVETARRILLEIIVQQQPQDERRIHALAKATVDSADKDSRASEENSIAYALAEAPPNGVDLKSAEAWARDAVKQTTMPVLREQMKGMFANAKDTSPAAKAKQEATIENIWKSSQAANLQTLADVYLHEGKLADATAALDQAQALNPVQGANFVTRGQIAHAQHHDDQALDALETAEVYGGMTPAAQELLTTLYAAQHGGDRNGLDAEIDRRYQALYKPMAPARHTASTSGRSVLLSLYTGSACDPCVAADMAVDAVLQNYPRTDVVALAFDEHIPGPDPLANAATVARGTYDGVHFTPTLRINGEEAPQIGGDRSGAEKSYEILTAALDKHLSTPSGASLRLAGNLTPAHTLTASAHFLVTDANALRKLLSAKPDSARGDSATAKAPNLVLNFALVQREVRYSGENGIRFHAMVVRDLAKPTADAFPVALTGPSTASFTFDPAAVSSSLSKYLADFAQHNDRFGAPHFLTTDTTLPLDQLAVAAWVEDLISHRVVAAAYAPLGGSGTEQASR